MYQVTIPPILDFCKDKERTVINLKESASPSIWDFGPPDRQLHSNYQKGSMPIFDRETGMLLLNSDVRVDQNNRRVAYARTLLHVEDN
jgi:hypothetical protein